MIERFLDRTEFTGYEDFCKGFHVNVPDRFNFGSVSYTHLTLPTILRV